MLKDLVGRFVREELLPLESAVLARDAENGKEQRTSDFGGARTAGPGVEGDGALEPRRSGRGRRDGAAACRAMVGVNEELGSSRRDLHLAAGFAEPAHAHGYRQRPHQRRRISIPTRAARRSRRSGISEPGAGGDRPE